MPRLRAVCEKDAIDFTQVAEYVDVKVGAIVLSPGYETFDPKLRGDHGYGTMANVVTSLEFERLLCATGPHEGEVLRPSTGSTRTKWPGFTASAPGKSSPAATVTALRCAALTSRNR